MIGMTLHVQELMNYKLMMVLLMNKHELTLQTVTAGEFPASSCFIEPTPP